MNETTISYYYSDWEYAGILNFTQSISDFCEKIQLALVITVIVINIFHLIILSQKSMRANSINIILIGIAISDLLFLTYFVYLELIRVDKSLIEAGW